MLLGKTGEVIEQFHQVLTQFLVGGEQAQVGVELGGFGVVVARADVHIALQLVLLLAHHQNNLGVGFQPQHSVDHMHSGLLQVPGPLDVVVFVKSCFQFHQCHHLLAVFGGTDQCSDDRRVFGGAVERHLDAHHLGIVRCLVDELFDGCREEVIGMVQKDVLTANHREDRSEFIRFDRSFVDQVLLTAGKHRRCLASVALALEFRQR